MDQPTNGELAIMLGGLTEKVDLLFKKNSEDHSTIVVQTTKTNGRVTKLESYKNMVVGALAVIVVVLGWLVSFIIKKL